MNGSQVRGRGGIPTVNSRVNPLGCPVGYEWVADPREEGYLQVNSRMNPLGCPVGYEWVAGQKEGGNTYLLTIGLAR